MNTPTTERLALALEQAGAVPEMVAAARAGRYDDFKSESATPIVDLVRDLETSRLFGLAARAKNGEFDAPKWESDEWAKSMASGPEMGPLMKLLMEKN